MQCYAFSSYAVPLTPYIQLYYRRYPESDYRSHPRSSSKSLRRNIIPSSDFSFYIFDVNYTARYKLRGKYAPFVTISER